MLQIADCFGEVLQIDSGRLTEDFHSVVSHCVCIVSGVKVDGRTAMIVCQCVVHLCLSGLKWSL